MRKIILASLFALPGFSAFSQPSLANLNVASQQQSSGQNYDLKLTSPTQASLQFTSASNLTKADVKGWLASSLGLRQNRDDLRRAIASTQYSNGVEIEKYQQYFGGVKVEHGFINVLLLAGKASALQMEFYPLDENLSVTPVLTNDEAFKKATDFVGASKYVWENYSGNDPELKKPVGSLVIVEDYYGKGGKLGLAYKFEIYAEQPLSRSYVYVSAADGRVLLVDRIIKHFGTDVKGKDDRAITSSMASPFSATAADKPWANVSATAQTRYSGTQNIVTDDGSSVAGKPYRLRQVRNGHNITTLNYQRLVRSTANDAAAVDFTDNDNNWTTAEYANNYDDAALDVQFAMQFVSDYWKNIHNRNSWNNAGGEMKSYVHVRASASAGYDNAFWSGSAMYYGDGTYYSTDGTGGIANAGGFKPLTSLDVSAHELGHAVCQTTAQLVYQRESGGMNEGFSDIWAACVENYSGLPKSPFLIGEEIKPGAGALRSMQDPKLYGNPDTYGGQYWGRVTLASCPVPGSSTNDVCWVHYNSGVLNKWFYLITQGASGTNDNGDSYSVSGLGFSKSEKIAFLLEQSLTPNADYAAARTASINAATTLYGACSNEVIQVTNAWFAVGVGATANCTPVVEFVKSSTSVTEGDGLAGTCSSTRVVSVPVKLGSVATQKTDVQFSFGGTAAQGANYTVASPVVTFNAGESGSKNLDITVLDNATVEGTKTITLSYTVNANSGNGAAGVNNQAHTVTITDDDVLPTPIKSAPVSTVTLLNENFESSASGTTFPAGWNSTLAFTGGGSATNVWTIGPNAGTGITGQSAYISNTSASTFNYAYTLTSTTDRLLRLPVLNTTGLTNIRLSFKYKVGGEADPINPANTNPNYYPALYDYARILYDAGGTGTSFATLFNTPANDAFALYGDGTTAATFNSFALPSTMENKAAAYVGFRWTNDAGAGNGIPLAVDDILITARTAGTSIESTAGGSNSVRVLSGALDNYVASSGGTNLLAKISNASEVIPCLTATVTQGGSGRAPITTYNGTYFRTQKVVQLSPSVANSSATYQATFYFTAADLTGWTPAEIQQLKILKVKEGVNLNGTLSQADAVAVTPVFTDNSANGYYSYTANFTGFSQFMLVSSNIALPVNLLTFEATPRKKTVTLSWSTASELNNKGFSVERSSNGIDFTAIGWVKGGGTGSTASDYTFADNFVQPNVTYQYRLKQTDNDGRFKYSATRQARIADAGITVTISPNPVKGVMKVFVAGNQEPANISLLSANGQKVAEWQKVAAGAGYQVDLSRFGKGYYTVVVRLANEEYREQVLLQ